MNRRVLVPVLLSTVALLAVTGLAGCGTKAGAAAVLGDQRISQDTVQSYVVTNAAPPTPAAGATAAATASRPIVLGVLILQDLMTRALQANGGVPDDGQLDALHDAVFKTLFQTSLTGAQADQAVRTQIGEPNRLKPSFDAVFLRSNELELALIERLKLTAGTQLAAVVGKLGVAVTVNPRFGSWDPTTLSLTGTSTPDFLTLPSDSASPAAS